MQPYDNSEQAARRELSVEELEFVQANQRAFLKDPSKIMHLVGRALITVKAGERRVKDLQDSVEKMRLSSSSKSHPVEVALETLRNLDEEQKEIVLDYHTREMVAKADKAVKDAERAQSAARSEGNKLRFTVSKLAENTALPAAAQEALKAALKSMAPREEAPSVPVQVANDTYTATLSTIPAAFLPPPKTSNPDDLGSMF